MQRGAVERNPALGQDAWQQIAVKTATTAAAIWIAGGMEQRSKVLSYVLRGMVIGAWSAAAVHNNGVMR